MNTDDFEDKNPPLKPKPECEDKAKSKDGARITGKFGLVFYDELKPTTHKWEQN